MDTLGVAGVLADLLEVNDRVHAHRADPSGQAQTSTRQAHHEHLEHGVQERHPVSRPLQLAFISWRQSAVYSLFTTRTRFRGRQTTRFTCVVGLQDAPKGLPVVVTPQAQLFVDVTRRQLHFEAFVAAGNRSVDLMVERAQVCLLQDVHLT